MNILTKFVSTIVFWGGRLQLLSDAFPRCPVSEVWEGAQGGLLPPLIRSPRPSPQNPSSSHPNYATPFLQLSTSDLCDPCS